ncbi:MAG TPA: hypothetical protein VIF82_01810 [Burkholderiaceae bacterium]
MILQVETSEAPSDWPQPTGFFLGEKHIDVVQIIDRWPSADHVYFKVQADDGSTYILRHDENPDQWEMTFFGAVNQPDEPYKRAGHYLI